MRERGSVGYFELKFMKVRKCDLVNEGEGVIGSGLVPGGIWQPVQIPDHLCAVYSMFVLFVILMK